MGSETLKSVEVEVIYQQSPSDSLRQCRYTAKIGSDDTFRKIKKHITERFDIQGKLMYGKYNCDESPLKKMSDCTSGSKFYHTTLKKSTKWPSQHITLHVLNKDGIKSVQKRKIAENTTINRLKHIIQDSYAIYTCGRADRTCARSPERVASCRGPV